MKKTIKKLTGKEREWVESQLRAAVEFVDTFSPEDAKRQLSLRVFDRAFAAWVATGEVDGKKVNKIVNCVGIAIGQFLVDGIGLEWVTVSDEHNSTLAVHGLPGRGDVLVYPVKMVTERWEARSEESFEESCYQISRRITKIAGSQVEKKPWWKVW